MKNTQNLTFETSKPACPCCGQEIESVFQVMRIISLEGGKDAAFVWQDYCSLAGGCNDDQLEHMVAELRDPQFEFASINCDPSWLKADKRMMQFAAELVLVRIEEPFPDAPSEADLDNLTDWQNWLAGQRQPS
jgi:hypothetical protein